MHRILLQRRPQHRELKKNKSDKIPARDANEPANTEWTSLILLASKKDRLLYFSVGKHRLYLVTVQDSYRILRKDECTDSLEDGKVFPSLDANAGYWQSEMDEHHKGKTNLVPHHSLYRKKTNVIRLNKRPVHVPARNGRSTEHGKMAVFPGFSIRWRRILKVPNGAYHKRCYRLAANKVTWTYSKR